MFERIAPSQPFDADAWQANHKAKSKEAVRCRGLEAAWLAAAIVPFLALISFLIPVLDGSATDMQNIGLWVSFVMEMGCVTASRLYTRKFEQAVRDSLSGPLGTQSA